MIEMGTPKEEWLKEYKYAFPLIGGILVIIAFFTPATSSEFLNRWLWGAKQFQGEWTFEYDLTRLVISLVFGILLLLKGIKIVRISNDIRNDEIDLDENKIDLIQNL